MHLTTTTADAHSPKPGPTDHTARTRIVFGPGTVDRLGPLVREHGGTATLVVTDRGIIRTGHLEQATRSLEAAGVRVAVFDGVRENPTPSAVARCVERAHDAEIDFVVGFGGGSSLDVAKACNLILNGGRLEDFWGGGSPSEPLLPMIAVPTTAGTGSECQSFALISQETTHRKMACGTPTAAPRVAILDPRLTLTLPHHVTTCSGFDALSHTVESAVTTRRTQLSSTYSREAFRLCLEGLDGVLADRSDISARGNMLMGSALAGLAIENSMLGAAHAMANPLTARYGIVHGQAVGLTLPAVVRFNAELPEARRIYRDLVTSGSPLSRRDTTDETAGEHLVQILEEVLDRAGLAKTAAELGITEADIEGLAADAAEQWTSQFNPREVTLGDFTRLYQTILRGDR